MFRVFTLVCTNLIVLVSILTVSMLTSESPNNQTFKNISKKLQTLTYRFLQNDKLAFQKRILTIKNDHKFRNYPTVVNNIRYMDYSDNFLRINIKFLEANVSS